MAGIYLGDETVIHFTPGGGQEIRSGTALDWFISSSSSSSKPSSDSPCPTCGDRASANGVVSSCLDCFLHGGKIYRFRYGVPPAYAIAKRRGGTCSTAKSDPPDVVIRRATLLLEIGFGGYDLVNNNCEDFSLYCKKGFCAGKSGQVKAYLVAAVVLLGLILI
ncbi:hypothetical protein M569_17243 [Genlisea aurea]|uniref:LRAT domain-containing protein n=1 Tax=Genlisea aurea TaxID=192259 RepID=S8BT50_9LAMI|nr:hypothetical protein M569_17243 [Genlisea aurea]